VLPEPPAPRALSQAADRRAQVDARLEARVASDLHDPETRRQLLWIRYVEALYYAAHGGRAWALAAAEAGLQLSPHTRELSSLRAALAGSTGPVDLTPFLPHGSAAP
jgi:hypothetical protein